MLKKLSEKLRVKFPATTPGCSVQKCARLDDAFLEVFLTASKPSRRSITAAKRKKKKKKGMRKKIPKIEKPENFDFCACPSHNDVKRDAGGKKGKLLCCKHIFQLIWPSSSLKSTKMSKKRIFLQKAPGVDGLVN